jgi:hypothetical protein
MSLGSAIGGLDIAVGLFVKMGGSGRIQPPR